MKIMYRILTLLIANYATTALADGNRDNYAVNRPGAVLSYADTSNLAAFGILAAHNHRSGNSVTFHMTTNGVAGAETPNTVGAVGGSARLVLCLAHHS